ncbi:MAG: hypothetical protein PWP23_1640 [Candidatus Sumerlaeota bacterium]|nr:hypothetical protein [Candidatus Sumerlaeota bacterium]
MTNQNDYPGGMPPLPPVTAGGMGGVPPPPPGHQYATPPPPKKKSPLPVILIVLGILFIVGICCLSGLAAIGIPSFLEAKARSKVSRVRSDMRSLATAIEAYYVDNNAFPTHTTNSSLSINSHPTQGASSTRPSFRIMTQRGQQTLTTPIAYVYTYYPDSFAPFEGLTFCYYTDGGGWILWSPGPDEDYDIVPERDYTSEIAQPSPYLLSTVTYDPTNGTVSDGDVWRVKQ